MKQQPDLDNNKTAVAIFDKRALEYQNKYMSVDLYEDTFDLFCDHIEKEKAEILELACGPGNITRYLLDKRPDFQILGIDLAPNMIELAKQNNPGAEFLLMDCRDIGQLNKKYDAIMCGFCLPYLSKEESVQLIRDVAGLLNPGGIFYISTMEDDYSKSGFQTSGSGDRMYIYYHPADYLTHALVENSFEIIDLRRQPFPNPAGNDTTDLLITAQKQERPSKQPTTDNR